MEKKSYVLTITQVPIEHKDSGAPKFNELRLVEGNETQEAVVLRMVKSFDQPIEFLSLAGELVDNIYTLVSPYDELIKTFMEKDVDVSVHKEGAEMSIIVTSSNGTVFPMGNIRPATQINLSETFIRLVPDNEGILRIEELGEVVSIRLEN